MSENAAEQAGIKQPRGLRHPVAAVLSAVLWALGFFLAFLIPKGSPYIWAPDFLLLIGFVPLLNAWKPSWPWLVFGALNIAIGFVLEVARYLSDSDLPGDMQTVRAHLSEYHAPLVWILIGAACILWGVFRMVCNLILKPNKSKP